MIKLFLLTLCKLIFGQYSYQKDKTDSKKLIKLSEKCCIGRMQDLIFGDYAYLNGMDNKLKVIMKFLLAI